MSVIHGMGPSIWLMFIDGLIVYLLLTQPFH
jgi:hypothetical protein